MPIDVNVITTCWDKMGIIASFVVAAIALLIGILSLRHSSKLQTDEMKRRNIKEIIDWATRILVFFDTPINISINEILQIMKYLRTDAGEFLPEEVKESYEGVSEVKKKVEKDVEMAMRFMQIEMNKDKLLRVGALIEESKYLIPMRAKMFPEADDIGTAIDHVREGLEDYKRILEDDAFLRKDAETIKADLNSAELGLRPEIDRLIKVAVEVYSDIR